jgi:hypothetical protein
LLGALSWSGLAEQDIYKETGESNEI